jgi:hypothetical protein
LWGFVNTTLVSICIIRIWHCEKLWVIHMGVYIYSYLWKHDSDLYAWNGSFRDNLFLSIINLVNGKLISVGKLNKNARFVIIYIYIYINHERFLLSIFYHICLYVFFGIDEFWCKYENSCPWDDITVGHFTCSLRKRKNLHLWSTWLTMNHVSALNFLIFFFIILARLCLW